MNKIYAVEDIFQEIDNDPENVLMTIPPEICKKMGWEPGDVLTINVEEGIISIKKVDNGKK